VASFTGDVPHIVLDEGAHVVAMPDPGTNRGSAKRLRETAGKEAGWQSGGIFGRTAQDSAL